MSVGLPATWAGLGIRLGALGSDTSGLKSRLGHLEDLCPGQTSVSSSLEWEGYT